MPSTHSTDQIDIPTPRELADWINPVPCVPVERHSAKRPRHSLKRLDLVLAVGLFAMAMIVRWPLILRGETLLHSDEAIVGLMAQDIAAGERFPIYFYGQRYMGALEAYVIAAITPLFDDPIHALRAGPTLFFGALVAAQFLMLTRWFGRRGGLVGAIVLLAAPPMFAQWSISARGGYIEILLLGTLLLWSYTEGFAGRQPGTPAFRRFGFGLILGAGLWINPSIVLFILPIAAHYLLQRLPGLPPSLRRMGILTLPLILLAGILLLNTIWSVHVDQGRVHSQLLLGVLPKTLAVILIGVVISALTVALQYRLQLFERSRGILRAAGPMIAGVVIGASPAVYYVLQTAVGLRQMEPALPLGLRPLWTVGDTLSYLWHGLPLLFGADARPFLSLVTIGRPSALEPLDIMTSGWVLGANWLVLGAMTTASITFLVAYRSDITRLLRLQPGGYSPTMLLWFGAAGTVLLFLLSGAAHDFNTIRYLIPLWAFIPGLLAAIFTQPMHRTAGRAAPLYLCLAWTLGQWAMWSQLGALHPLRPLANEIVARKLDPAVAEIFDAHLLSYLTRQQCRVAESNPFWSRLSHYRPALDAEASVSYIVLTSDDARDVGTTHWPYPGPPPPEVHRPLWKKLQRVIDADPTLLISREPLTDGFELIRLRKSRQIP